MRCTRSTPPSCRSKGTNDGDGDGDVPDPIGRPAEAHEEASELLAGALLPILARLAALHDDAVTRP